MLIERFLFFGNLLLQFDYTLTTPLLQAFTPLLLHSHYACTTLSLHFYFTLTKLHYACTTLSLQFYYTLAALLLQFYYKLRLAAHCGCKREKKWIGNSCAWWPSRTAILCIASVRRNDHCDPHRQWLSGMARSSIAGMRKNGHCDPQRAAAIQDGQIQPFKHKN